MKRPYQIAGIVTVVISAVLVREAMSLQYWSMLGPGPGFFPFWISVGMGLLGAIMFLQATFGRSGALPDDFFATGAGYLKIGAIIGATCMTMVLMTPLGFRLTMLAFYVFTLLALGRQNPVVSILVALAGSFGVYHIFVEWLSVPLPTGLLGV